MADSIAIGLPSSGSGSGGSTILENQVAHGFSLLDGIYHNGTVWVKAKADDGDTVAIYCISKVTDVDNFEATKFGSITATAHGKTIGEYYFLDNSVSGTPTLTAPSSGFSNPLFYVEDVDTVHMIVHRAVDVDQAPVTSIEISDYNSSEWEDITADIGPIIGYNGGTLDVGTGGGAEYTVDMRRDGTNAEIRYTVRIGTSGAVDAIGAYIFPMLPGESKQSHITGYDAVGYGTVTITGAAGPRTRLIAKPFSTGFIVDQGDAIHGDALTLMAAGDGILFNNQNKVSVLISVPIQGWTDKTVSTKVVLQTEVVNPNFMINGDMRINQRDVLVLDAAPTTFIHNSYSVDRFMSNFSVIEAVHEYKSINQPPSFSSSSRSLRVTCTDTDTLDPEIGYMGIRQYVEDFMIYAGKTVTFSAWVKSNHVEARIYVAIQGAAPAFNTVSEGHSGSGEWELLTLTINMPTTGTHINSGVFLYDGALVSIASGDFLEMTGYKLEFGSVATNFIPDTYGVSLQKCMRYYQLLNRNLFSYANAGGFFWPIIDLSVPMREGAQGTILSSSSNNLASGSPGTIVGTDNVSITGYTHIVTGVANNVITVEVDAEYY